MLDGLNPVDSERWKSLVANSPRPDAYYPYEAQIQP
jgi:hypothetical protein